MSLILDSKCKHCGDPFGKHRMGTHQCPISGGNFELNQVFEPSDEAVENPLTKQVAGDHYKKLKIQPIEYIHANGIPFAEGCAIKYLTRWRDKGGIADLEKAKHFIELLIELEKKNEAPTRKTD